MRCTLIVSTEGCSCYMQYAPLATVFLSICLSRLAVCPRPAPMFGLTRHVSSVSVLLCLLCENLRLAALVSPSCVIVGVQHIVLLHPAAVALYF